MEGSVWIGPRLQGRRLFGVVRDFAVGGDEEDEGGEDEGGSDHGSGRVESGGWFVAGLT